MENAQKKTNKPGGYRKKTSICYIHGEKMKELFQQGKSFREIGQKFSITGNSVGLYIKKYHKDLYDKRRADEKAKQENKINQIIALYEQGESQKSISDKLGIDPVTVHNHISRHKDYVRERNRLSSFVELEKTVMVQAKQTPITQPVRIGGKIYRDVFYQVAGY